MSTRDSGGQDRTTRRTEEPEEAPPEDDAGPDTAAARKAALDEDVDAMLDEIDEVLETNAEEFVRGFVQKGGE
jgi:prokaryotic ubiquitin-like protein Pup